MIEIKAPEFPESIADGEVATWHVAEGEAVKRDQVLVDIETDKVVLEVVAPADGVLVRIVKQEGETVLAEEMLGQFEAGEVTASATTEQKTEDAAPEADADDDAETIASPAARKLAEESNLDVTQIEGTGKGGRITKEDVLKAVAATQSQPTIPAPAPAASDRTRPAPR